MPYAQVLPVTLLRERGGRSSFAGHLVEGERGGDGERKGGKESRYRARSIGCGLRERALLKLSETPRTIAVTFTRPLIDFFSKKTKRCARACEACRFLYTLLRGGNNGMLVSVKSFPYIFDHFSSKVLSSIPSILGHGGS